MEGEQAQRRLLSMGVWAWNAALTSSAKQQKMIDDFVREIMRSEDEQLQAMFKDLLSELVDRKKRYFAQYTRPILDFILTDLGDGLHLTVISALPGMPR